MIGRENESSLVAIFRHGLHEFPKLLHKMVESVCALQHQVVTALMRPVVGLAVAHKKYPGMICLHIVEQWHLQKRIENIVAVEAGLWSGTAGSTVPASA